MAAVVIAGRQFHRNVDHSTFFIDADLAPYSRVSCVRRGIVLPGFGSILIRQRDGMEDPETLARSYIETSNLAFRILLTGRPASRFVRGADDHGIAGDDGSGVEPDLSAQWIDL